MLGKSPKTPKSQLCQIPFIEKYIANWMIEFQKKILFKVVSEASFCIMINLFHILVVISYYA